jgi:hypothetical protein
MDEKNAEETSCMAAPAPIAASATTATAPRAASVAQAEAPNE